jgi:aerobic carbon-monoxide dehydrogenase medium subunit
MKAAAFDYVRAASVSEACALLAQYGEAARLIAGGQSLVPALNLRLQTPELLIDISRIGELRQVIVKDDILTIGAMTRHADLQHSPIIAQAAPLLAQAVAHVAHPAIRNRGSIGGNLAHADPASELPACMLALAATLVVEGQAVSRRIPAADFFRGLFETALAPDEILCAIEIPCAKPQERFAFHELARRHGDYAIVGVACRAVLSGDRISELYPVYFSAGDRPILARTAAAHLRDRPLIDAAIAEAADALAADLEPHDDLQVSAATRLDLARVLFKRVIADVTGRANGQRCS